MNTADTLTNEDLITRLKEAKDRYNSARNIYFDLDKEFKRRLSYTEIMEGQCMFPLPFTDIKGDK